MNFSSYCILNLVEPMSGLPGSRIHCQYLNFAHTRYFVTMHFEWIRHLEVYEPSIGDIVLKMTSKLY